MALNTTFWWTILAWKLYPRNSWVTCEEGNCFLLKKLQFSYAGPTPKIIQNNSTSPSTKLQGDCGSQDQLVKKAKKLKWSIVKRTQTKAKTIKWSIVKKTLKHAKKIKCCLKNCRFIKIKSLGPMAFDHPTEVWLPHRRPTRSWAAGVGGLVRPGFFGNAGLKQALYWTCICMYHECTTEDISELRFPEISKKILHVYQCKLSILLDYQG